MPVLDYGPKVTIPGMGSDVDEEQDTPHPGDSSDTNVAHRHDKMAYREDLGRLECACHACGCGDSTACIRKKCSCCTVSK